MRCAAPRARGAAAVLLLAVAVAGCDDSADEDPGAKLAAKAPRETVHHVPKLPDGWTVHINRRGGFGFGLPRGWKADDRGPTTLVRSFDRLVAVSITADRSQEALGLEPREFARRTAVSLRGYERLEPGSARRYRHRYDGFAVRAKARAKRSGVKQRVRVVVLPRPELAVYTAVVAVNAERASAESESLAERVLETLRGRPAAERKRQPSRSGRSG